MRDYAIVTETEAGLRILRIGNPEEAAEMSLDEIAQDFADEYGFDGMKFLVVEVLKVVEVKTEKEEENV